MNQLIMASAKALHEKKWKMADAFEYCRNQSEYAADMAGMTAREFQTTYWSRADGPYPCEHCEMEFETSQGRGAHRRVHEPKKQNGPVADEMASGVMKLVSTGPEMAQLRRALLECLLDMDKVLDKHTRALEKLFDQ